MYISAYASKTLINEIRKIVEPKVIIELGSRDGIDAVTLSKVYPEAKVYTFEANPKQANTCRANIDQNKNIEFFSVAVGSRDTELEFHEYVKDNNVGASSLFKRLDYDNSQKTIGTVPCRRLDTILKKLGVEKIDGIFADIQGFEIEAIKGAGNYIKNCKFIYIEAPIVSSVYVGAPNHQEVFDYMKEINYRLVLTERENDLESNYLFFNMG